LESHGSHFLVLKSFNLFCPKIGPGKHAGDRTFKTNQQWVDPEPTVTKGETPKWSWFGVLFLLAPYGILSDKKQFPTVWVCGCTKGCHKVYEKKGNGWSAIMDHLANEHGIGKDTKHPTNISSQKKKVRDECKTRALDTVGAGRALRSSRKTCPSRGMLPAPRLPSAERRQRRCSKLYAQRKRTVFGLPDKHTAAVTTTHRRGARGSRTSLSLHHFMLQTRSVAEASVMVVDLDAKTGLLTDLLTGIQGWKCPVAMSQTCYGSKSLKVILMDSNFGGHPVLNPLSIKSSFSERRQQVLTGMVLSPPK
jgi:hypothetical protein